MSHETDFQLTDDGEQTYTINSIDIDGGELQFKRGVENSRMCLFYLDENGANHTETYERLRDNYAENLSEGVVKTIKTYNGVPRYTQNINPLADANSYLFHFAVGENHTELTDWWVVIKQIEDESTLVGAAEAMEITFYPLTPDTGQTRTQIVDEYEV